MKIQLDLTNKTIKVEQEVNLDHFFKAIKKLLPNDLWKEFTLDPQVITNWSAPIVIKEYPIYPENVPSYPSYPWITCGAASTLTCLGKGTFNVEY